MEQNEEKNKEPIISVVMGVLYHSHDTELLERSIQSVLQQTMTDFEYLISADGSSNEAFLLLEKLAAKDGRIRLISSEGRVDLSSKLNACLKSAKGKYVARMDDDDFSHSSRFAEQINVLEKKPEISFVGSNVNLIFEGKRIGERRFPKYPQIKDFYFSQPYIHPSLMFRKSVLVAVGGYSEKKTSDPM